MLPHPVAPAIEHPLAAVALPSSPPVLRPSRGGMGTGQPGAPQGPWCCKVMLSGLRTLKKNGEKASS